MVHKRTVRKPVTCEICHRRIISEADLVVAQYFIFPQPYHGDCYSKRLKTWGTVFLNNYPINSVMTTTFVLLSPIFGILWFAALINMMTALWSTPLVFVFVPFFILGLFALFLPGIIRLYSYYTFEKPIEKMNQQAPFFVMAIPIVMGISVVVLIALFFITLNSPPLLIIPSDVRAPESCTVRDTSCCQNESCSFSVPTCVEGKKPNFQGCDDRCWPMWKCV